MECPVCGVEIESLSEFQRVYHVEGCLSGSLPTSCTAGFKEHSGGGFELLETGGGASEEKEEEEDILCPFEGCNLLVSVGSWEDHVLAHQLEDERPKGENTAQLPSTFSQARVFGSLASKKEGSVAQSVRHLERLVESGKISPSEFHMRKAQLLEQSSTGVDDLSTCSTGIIPYLKQYYHARGHHSSTKHPPTGTHDSSYVYFLSADTWHMSSALGDRGWGCGYRNIQMVFSALLQMASYRRALAQKGVFSIPSIPKLQQMLEDAWKEGFDPKGREALQGKVHQTRKWIGATEAVCIFRNLNLRAQVVDFVHPTGDNSTHPRLFTWLKSYFQGRYSTSDDSEQPKLRNGKRLKLHTAAAAAAVAVDTVTVKSNKKGGIPSSLVRQSSWPQSGKEDSASASCLVGAGGVLRTTCRSAHHLHLLEQGQASACVSGSAGGASDAHCGTNSQLVGEDSSPVLPPLYLQHEGHSRTIVGMEERPGKPSQFLILLDPSHSKHQAMALLSCVGTSSSGSSRCSRLLHKSINQLKSKQYQVVFINGVFPEEDKEEMKFIAPYQRFT